METPMLILVCLLAVPALVACTSMWFYRKKLLRMLPDLPRRKATKKEHYRFKASCSLEVKQLEQLYDHS